MDARELARNVRACAEALPDVRRARAREPGRELPRVGRAERRAALARRLVAGRTHGRHARADGRRRPRPGGARPFRAAARSLLLGRQARLAAQRSCPPWPPRTRPGDCGSARATRSCSTRSPDASRPTPATALAHRPDEPLDRRLGRDAVLAVRRADRDPATDPADPRGLRHPRRATRARRDRRPAGRALRPRLPRAVGDWKLTLGTGGFALAPCEAGQRASAAAAGLVPTVAWDLGAGPVHALDAAVPDVGTAIDWSVRAGFAPRVGTCDPDAPLVAASGLVALPLFAGLGCPDWDRGGAPAAPRLRPGHRGARPRARDARGRRVPLRPRPRRDRLGRRTGGPGAGGRRRVARSGVPAGAERPLRTRAGARARGRANRVSARPCSPHAPATRPTRRSTVASRCTSCRARWPLAAREALERGLELARRSPPPARRFGSSTWLSFVSRTGTRARDRPSACTTTDERNAPDASEGIDLRREQTMKGFDPTLRRPARLHPHHHQGDLGGARHRDAAPLLREGHGAAFRRAD